jgi:hypothetical protein
MAWRSDRRAAFQKYATGMGMTLTPKERDTIRAAFCRSLDRFLAARDVPRISWEGERTKR